MMPKWIGDSSDIGGILRKPNNVNQNVENKASDLLVFGYACKVFRDDEKALYIDQGKHLISMGDETLKIDRYDVRATLSDLSQYEPPPGGYMNRMEYLSPAEQRAEQLCEEERYYSLYHNEDEERMYQEEELKRLHQEASSSYGQVAFDYNADRNNKDEKEEEKLEEPDEVYSVPKNLNLPPSIVTPDTMKLHAIIEKTAKFISTQGAQMEILIKAKQSNNPQFDFLNQSNQLNPYYKFLLSSFKDGTYPVQEQSTQNNGQDNTNPVNNSDFQIDTTEVQSTFAYPSIPIPTIKYKPSANCAYTQLISKIKGVPLPPAESPETKEEQIHVPTLLDYNSYYTQQQQQQQQQYSTDGVPAYQNTSIEQQQEEQQQNVVAQEQKKIESINLKDGVEIKKISTGLMLAQCYASDTEDECESEQSQTVLNFPIPPDYLQNIIDKTAIYVAKNGKQFEDTLRNKQDDRFLFLDPSNEYNPYYMYKVTGMVPPCPTTSNEVEENSKPKISTPVSFSIKPKEDCSVPLKPALPQEASDDESDTNKINSSSPAAVTNQFKNASVPEQVQKAIQLVERQLIVKGAQFGQISQVGVTTISGNFPQIGHSPKTRFDVDNTGTIVNRASLISPPVLPVKSKILHQKELKRAEEKVKDRLAQIAREKLGLISKEKQLQLERKKKAMAFLTQIKNSGITLSASGSEEAQNTEDDDLDSASDNSSVHSIPISMIEEKNEITTIKKHSKNATPSSTLTLTKTDDRPAKRRSRSKSRSKEKSHKRKKKSKHHSKKNSKQRSRSRSRSRNRDRERDRSRTRSSSRDRKYRKRLSSRKSKKKRHDEIVGGNRRKEWH